MPTSNFVRNDAYGSQQIRWDFTRFDMQREWALPHLSYQDLVGK
ncbi:MAG: hypothetical protein VCF25_29030 [Candidatus Poribacteria bacterium]